MASTTHPPPARVLIAVAVLLVQSYLIIFYASSSCPSFKAAEVLPPPPVNEQQQQQQSVGRESALTVEDLKKVVASDSMDTRASHLSPSFTLVVVRCHDNASSWLPSKVPSDWRLVVYEKCGESLSPEHSIPLKHNYGYEECNGYLDFFRDFYHNLTDYTVLIHGDALATDEFYAARPDTTHRASRTHIGGGHTPFGNFTELVDGLKSVLLIKQQSASPPPPLFLHMGTLYRQERFGKDIFHGLAMQYLWHFFVTSPNRTDPPKMLGYKPSAHMVVHKHLIQRHAQETYVKLKYWFEHPWLAPIKDTRKLCCAMERLWHVWFLGNDAALLPTEYILTDRLYMTKPQSKTGERPVPRNDNKRSG